MARLGYSVGIQIIHLNDKSKRIYILDLIKILCFIPVSIHHFSVSMWSIPEFSPYKNVSNIWFFTEVFARTFAFSGQIILLVSSFLIAFTSIRHEKILKLLPLMLLFWFLSSVFDFSSENLYFWTWDIFPLIGFSLIVCFLAYHVKGTLYLMPILGLILLSIPFWEIKSLNDLPMYIKHILIGDCESELSAWPILPWSGIVFFGYGLGRLVKEYINYFDKYIHISEMILWISILMLTFKQLIGYYNIGLGTRFDCDGMRTSPSVTVSNVLFIVFIIRISILAKVNARLSKNTICIFISKLNISRYFGFSYFLHFLVISFLTVTLKQFSFETMIYMTWMSAVFVLPITEVMLALMLRLKVIKNVPKVVI